ncbi:MAG: hypothetical protein JXR48_12825 [Candidatus Delongbacteria bacterium]|nr:hypothetical protein [Candidatus Delongbacteria bacterium]MBN2835836.1 hypothetical protein [Candidatus Delongbacteria bacterium]
MNNFKLFIILAFITLFSCTKDKQIYKRSTENKRKEEIRQLNTSDSLATDLLKIIDESGVDECYPFFVEKSNTIYFQRKLRDGFWTIAKKKLDKDTVIVQIYDDNSNCTNPVVDNDGRYIAYLSDRYGITDKDGFKYRDVILYDSDLKISKVLSDRISDNYSVKINGAKIYFISNTKDKLKLAYDKNEKLTLFCYNLETKSLEEIVLNYSFFDYYPSGNFVCFIDNEFKLKYGTVDDIKTFDIDGYCGDPIVSGDKIFISHRNENIMDFYYLDINTGTKTKMEYFGGFGGYFPVKDRLFFHKKSGNDFGIYSNLIK